MKLNTIQDYEKYILENFEYKNGELYRHDRKNSTGSIDKDGYRIIKVKGKQFKAHRIVWLLCNGKFPDAELDHINRNRLDNRIENLRESNRYQQCLNQNKKVNKDTGYVGIHEDKTTKGLLAKYTFRLNKKCYRFRTLEEAVKKRNEILEEMRSEHGNF